MTITYKETPDFLRDLKRLRKRFMTLVADLEVAKRNAIELFHLQQIDNHSVFQIPSFSRQEVQIFKLKKFACKALKGRGVQSGIRVIYSFFLKEKVVEFIEIYFKGDKENEDQQRISDYLASISI